MTYMPVSRCLKDIDFSFVIISKPTQVAGRPRATTPTRDLAASPPHPTVLNFDAFFINILYSVACLIV